MCDALVNITIACMIDLRYLKHPFSGLFAFNLDLINGSVLLVNEIASWILHLFSTHLKSLDFKVFLQGSCLLLTPTQVSSNKTNNELFQIPIVLMSSSS